MILRKFLLITLLIIVGISTGCTSKEKKIAPKDCVLLKGSFWVQDSNYMHDLRDAVYRQDKEYLKQLMLEGKIYQTDRDVRVIEFGVTAEKNDALIKFKEGKYTNKAGVTLKKNLMLFDDYVAVKQKEAKKLEEKRIKEFQEREDRIAQHKEEVQSLRNLFQSTVDEINQNGCLPEGEEINIPAGTNIFLGEDISSMHLFIPKEITRALVLPKAKFSRPAENRIELLDGVSAGRRGKIYNQDYKNAVSQIR